MRAARTGRHEARDGMLQGLNLDATVALAEAECAICLAGNHDLGVLGTIDIESFSPAAAEG